MGLHKDFDDGQFFSDLNFDEETEDLDNKKRVRRLLEERLDRKRLKEELDDELEGEFDWDNYEER